MKTLGRLRALLGYYKWYFFQGGRRKGAYAREAQRLQRRSERELHRLAPLPLPAESDVEAHLLCGHKQAVMGVWALWSFAHFTDRAYATFVHSDGTLTEGDRRRFREFFPNINFVDAAERDRRLAQTLAGDDLAHVRRFRNSHILAPKLVDPHMSPRAKVILLLDTDILFFGRPDELIRACDETKERRQVTSGRDVRTSYVAAPEVLRERLGMGVADILNSGIVVMPKFDREDFLLVDRALSRFEPAWLKDHFAEQTLYAIIAGERGWNPLSDLYEVGRGNPERTIAIHYASGLRQRMFTEGIPRLLAIVEGRAQPVGASAEPGRTPIPA